MSLTELVIKRSTIVVVLFTILALLGIACYTKLNYDLFPKMEIPIVSVITQYPGAGASEVEGSVTKKVEDALSSLEKTKSMQSTSQEGLSTVTIQLESNADIDAALQDAQRKVNAMLAQLPGDAKAPSINKFSSDDMPIIKLGVTAKMEPTRLYQITKDQIKARFSKINGVGQVSLVGGNEREIKVNINKSKLDAYKLSISQVYQAVENSNMEFPTGKIEGDTKQYTVRLSGKIKSIDILKNVIVAKNVTGSAVRLSDIAEIVDGVAEQDNLNRINGENSIGIVIQKQSDANSVNVSRLVKKEIDNMVKSYSAYDLKFNVAVDNSIYTMASANEVLKDLMYAILLVSLVMFFFLHSVRNSFIVMIAIPASIISVFTAMYVFDFSLNMMTLLALALIVGILVDDSIVILENIHRHLKMGKNRRQAAIDGRKEIGLTAVAITLVDVVVFLPLSLLGGMIGHMLREFALVVVFSTFMSLLVSFTVTPLLSSRLSRIDKLSKDTLMGKLALGFETLFNKLAAYYDIALRWGLHHRRTIYATALILIILAVSLIPLGFIGTEFIAAGDKGEFVIKLEGEPQNTLYQTNMLTQKVENVLLKKPQVIKVFSNIGYSSSSGFTGAGSSEQNKSEITVTLVPKQKRKQSVDDYAAMIKMELLNIPGLKVTSSAVSISGGTMESAIQILLRGPEIERLYKVADSVMLAIKSVPGTNDIKLSVEKSKPEMQISLNRDKMAILGLSVNDVGSTLRLAFAGNTDMQYTEGGTDYSINFKFDRFDRKKVEDIGSLTFLNNQGKIIDLRDFADISQSLSPNKLERYNRISSLTVNASVIGRPVGTVGQEIKAAIGKRVAVGDISIEFTGQMERQNEAFGSLGIAILAALILVYLVMVVLYNSYIHPFIVFFSIPVAVIGALFALALTRQTLSIFTIIGLIMLIGLVTKNAILLVDFTNQLREKGHSVFDALIEAGKVRLRPILMTTLSMVFGMLPIALASAEGAEVKNGMAWVIIGGLGSSLLLTLIVVPAVYMSLDLFKAKAGRLFAKKAVVEPSV